jgi:hypothetical protein
MGQNMAEEDLAGSIIHFCYQSVHIVLDVKHHKLANCIGAGEYSPHVRQVSPSGSLGDAIPGIQGLAKIGVFACRHEQFFAADDVQYTSDAAIVVRIMRTCQLRSLAGFQKSSCPEPMPTWGPARRILKVRFQQPRDRDGSVTIARTGQPLTFLLFTEERCATIPR